MLLAEDKFKIIKISLGISLAFHVVILILGLLLPPKNKLTPFFEIKIIHEEKIQENKVEEKQKIEKKVKKESNEKVNKKTSKQITKIESPPPPIQKKKTTSLKEKQQKKLMREEFLSSIEDDIFNTNKKTKIVSSSTTESKTTWKEKDLHVEKKGTATTNISESNTHSKTKWLGKSRRQIYFPKSHYPSYFRNRGIQGEVKLRLTVTADGHVSNVKILKSTGYTKLDLIAKNSALKARYSPSYFDKNDSTGEVIIYFRLKD